MQNLRRVYSQPRRPTLDFCFIHPCLSFNVARVLRYYCSHNTVNRAARLPSSIPTRMFHIHHCWWHASLFVSSTLACSVCHVWKLRQILHVRARRSFPENRRVSSSATSLCFLGDADARWNLLGLHGLNRLAIKSIVSVHNNISWPRTGHSNMTIIYPSRKTEVCWPVSTTISATWSILVESNRLRPMHRTSPNPDRTKHVTTSHDCPLHYLHLALTLPLSEQVLITSGTVHN